MKVGRTWFLEFKMKIKKIQRRNKLLNEQIIPVEKFVFQEISFEKRKSNKTILFKTYNWGDKNE